MDAGMIVGTAGHIDHGKSALVEALTGRTMDRLAEERRRGITIELGFAPFALPDGRLAGVIDVPGHEDFVRTMVAGASGIDVALLVVAADEGVMPQTEEHLLVLEELGIARGIPVITKTDLVDAEWLELVSSDVMERLARSSIAFAAPAHVSARTGEGVEELRERLVAALLASPARSATDLFRLPIDRAFSVAGVGTVVTGTCRSGTIGVGDAVRLLPEDRRGRVRSTESHGVQAVVDAGARVALGLAGIDRAQVARGDLLVDERAPWVASRAIDALVHLADTAARPITRRQRVRVHLGTGEWIGWVAPRTALRPGERGLARITLDRPAVARGGDRFVLRSFSPVHTIGGGEVVDPAPPVRAVWPGALAEAGAGRLAALVSRRRHGLAATELPVVLGSLQVECDRLAHGDPALVAIGERWIERKRIEALIDRIGELLDRHHRVRPAERGMPLESLRQGLRSPGWLVAAAIDAAAAAGTLLVEDRIARRPAFRSAEVRGADVARLVALLNGAGFGPPTTAELSGLLPGIDIAAALRAAAEAGVVEAVERDRHYARETLESFVEVLRELGGNGEIAVGTVRDRLGVSRKYLIPLLEWADRRGVTIRVGDARRYRGPLSPAAAVRAGGAAPA